MIMRKVCLILCCVVVANIMLVKATLKSVKLVPQKTVRSSYVIDKNVLLDVDSGKVFTCGNHYKARAYHVRGIIKCLGIDVCKVAGKFSPFFKDHDFVVVKYGDGAEQIVDPYYEDFVTTM